MHRGQLLRLALVLAFGGCRPGSGEAGPSGNYHAEYLAGRAEYALSASSPFLPIHQGQELPAGGRLRTFPGTLVTLRGSAGDRLAVAESALVSLAPGFLARYRASPGDTLAMARGAPLRGRLALLPDTLGASFVAPPHEPAQVAEPTRVMAPKVAERTSPIGRKVMAPDPPAGGTSMRRADNPTPPPQPQAVSGFEGFFDEMDAASRGLDSLHRNSR